MEPKIIYLEFNKDMDMATIADFYETLIHKFEKVENKTNTKFILVASIEGAVDIKCINDDDIILRIENCPITLEDIKPLLKEKGIDI